LYYLDDRYDREEGGATLDLDTAQPFLGDDATFKKRETEMTKRLVFCSPCQIIDFKSYPDIC
jgi:hypothetical protein